MSERFDITPLTGNGLVVLANDADQTARTIIVAPACLPAAEFAVQSFAPVRAESMKHIARGNVASPYVVICTRIHSSLRASLIFERDHIQAIVGACKFGELVLKRTVDSVTMKSIGALQRAACVQRTGTHTIWQYTWIGSAFTA